MRASLFFSQIIIVTLLLTSCGVDPRWGPPKSGLRKNLAWQYDSITAPSPPPSESPISMMSSVPIIPSAEIARPFLQNREVRLIRGQAVAPAHAPEVVKRAVAAGNRLQRSPYKFGGGHATLNDRGYDCSGSVSYVLREAGIISDQMPSAGFLNYGNAGEGEWITVWAKDGHVYMTVGGLRLDTGGSPKSDGPRWKTPTRSSSGFRPRHPAGL